MNRKLLLTSALAIGFACPAMADSFPQDGYMQEDTTYEEAANYDNMGVYSGEVTAQAEYTALKYNCGQGFYLNVDLDVPACTQCPTGYYCSGGYGLTVNDPITKTLCPSDYALSQAGAATEGQCYQSAEGVSCPASITPDHATNCQYASNAKRYKQNPNVIQGDITFGCEQGWHYDQGVNYHINDLQFDGWASSSGYKNNSNGALGANSSNANTYNLTTDNTWAVTITSGEIIKGDAACSITQGVSKSEIGSPDLSTSGNNCWCKISKLGNTSAPVDAWVWGGADNNAYHSEDNCNYHCASVCAGNASFPGNWSSSLLAVALPVAFESTPASCAGNPITITWTDASQADIEANNAGNAVYGDNINTPAKATVKKGYEFKGWKFVKPTPVQQ